MDKRNDGNMPPSDKVSAVHSKQKLPPSDQKDSPIAGASSPANLNAENSFIHEHPSIIEERYGDTLMRTYRWETPDNRQIFLHIRLSVQKSDTSASFIVAKANIDSIDVKGQGKFLWEFLKKELGKIRQHGAGDFQPSPVLHEVQPNQYSQGLVEGDTQYIQRNNLHYALYQ